ncbi:MAG TPA: hypothetical protein VKO63_05235 [Chitinispirillaceae bacterium]|nr:hypothetical protein [Chitinispirillaceae bacterium]
MIIKTILYCVMVIGILSTPLFSAPVKRMDIYDNTGNSLLFVEFEYDNNGNNIARSVFMADSSFVKRTVFTNDGSGNRVRENSFNFNDDTLGYTVFSSQNSRPSINVFDQFGLNQFGTAVSYELNGDDQYDIYHNGSVMYKMKYTYTDDGDPERINVLDKSGAILYYATFSSAIKTILQSSKSVTQMECIVTADKCKLTIMLKKESELKACIYNLSGKLVSVPYTGTLKAGMRSVAFRLDLTNAKKVASGMYIMRLFVDGLPVSGSKKYITAARRN